jgi:hypothetical protein
MSLIMLSSFALSTGRNIRLAILLAFFIIVLVVYQVRRKVFPIFKHSIVLFLMKVLACQLTIYFRHCQQVSKHPIRPSLGSPSCLQAYWRVPLGIVAIDNASVLIMVVVDLSVLKFFFYCNVVVVFVESFCYTSHSF